MFQIRFLKTNSHSSLAWPGQKRAAAVALILTLAFSACLPLAWAQTNTFDGSGAGQSITSGVGDSGFGYYALYSDTTGEYNTATGISALYSNTTASGNTASGASALYDNTTGGENTASGDSALEHNINGSNNTANGSLALLKNLAGSNNTATGYGALYSNTAGTFNVAVGTLTLYNNTTGEYNAGMGGNALFHNTTGGYNLALGLNALHENTTGGNNMAQGFGALYDNTTGSSNIAIGASAGMNLTTGSSNIDIGNAGVAGEAQTIRIGSSQTKAFIAGVHGAVASGGVAVYVTSSGQLGTSPSSKRFKEDIAPMDKQSEALLSLKPVTFRYKKELDPSKTAQFGLIAEEVAKVDPDLVARDDKGQIYSVRYEAVNAMLLNEFLKEHAKAEQQQKNFEAVTTRQEREITALTTMVKEQAAQIQRVSAQVATEASALKVADAGNR